MATFVIEFSPPEKIKLETKDVTDSVVNYRMVLAPFQKPTQVEFNNIKFKETAVRFLMIVNPLDQRGEFVLSSPGDGLYFDFYEFILEPYSQCKLSIHWKPFEYGNMRKLIKIEQVNGNRKYDFVILGNCNGPSYKKIKNSSKTYSKFKNQNLTKNQLKCVKENRTSIQIKVAVCKEKINSIAEDNPAKILEPVCAETQLSPNRRQTYLVREKENLPVLKKNSLGRDTVLTSPEHKIKRPDQKCQDRIFHKHFKLKNNSSSPMSDDSLETPLNRITIDNSLCNEFCLTPLKSSENLLPTFNNMNTSFDNQLTYDISDIPFSSTLNSSLLENSLKPTNHFTSFDRQLNYDIPDGTLASTSNSSPFYLENPLVTTTSTYAMENRKLSNMDMNTLCNNNIRIYEDELAKNKTNFGLDNINPTSFMSSSEVEQPAEFKGKERTLNGVKTKRHSFGIKNSPYYKYSPKSSIITKNKLKRYSTSSGKLCSRTVTVDKYDPQFNQDFLYSNNAEDPFLKMSQHYEAEWLNRQESDMIRWLNALLTPTDKLVDEEYSGDLEQAAMAWVEASKTSHKNKPMQFATEKDLFVAQIYRQSPQQWTALRKATTNLMSSTNVASVLSKLTISIENNLITVRDDRQIHLDLSLKKKIIDLLKCYNPLWLRIGLEAVYGQIIHVKVGSKDLDGIGWFVRKNLFNNDFVKHKFTKTTVLHVNQPSYNTAMKKFILRKILMLIYFLDRAKEHKLIRHNPCLFRTDSPYKSSYDLLMGFCADMVIAHGDIVRRMRSIGYNLTHKQIHLDEVNYAVKSLNDLRDGTRITKIVEILFKGNPLSQKLRLPAISKLQKIHNVNLAFTQISQHISIEGNISTRDIVNGHREKILSLFWQIIYKYLTPRYNDAATKIQNWWRNSSLKLIILKRIRVKQIAKRHLAASKIQAQVRGYRTRKQWPSLQSELIKHREMLHSASSKIKNYLKDKLKLLTEERKYFVILRRTIILVQRKFRTKMMMVKERRKYLKVKESVVIIQKLFRGYILRKKWPQIKSELTEKKLKQIRAINTIKRALRNNLQSTQDRQKFLKLKQTVLYVENLYIANKSMKLQKRHYDLLGKTTVFIQQKYKANNIMKREQEKYLKMKQSALLIQKMFRGFIVRKYWRLTTRNHLISEKSKRIAAINKVKQALRRNLPSTQDRIDFLKLKHTVLYVQRLYVANKSMQMQLEHYTTLKKTTVLIQRKYRANTMMKIGRKNYLKAKWSALLIQKTFRGYMLRKNWSDLQKCLMQKKKKRIDAINIVKQTLRRNLPKTQDRIDFEKLKGAVLFIQRVWRANKQMKVQKKCYTVTQSATVFVQRKFRAKVATRINTEIKLSAILIQRVYRGFAVRKNWPKVKKCMMEDNMKRVQAANVIKRALRKNLQPTWDKLYFETLRCSTVTVQQRFRANIAMRVQRDKFQTLKHSTIVIQRRFRANVNGKLLRDKYLQLKATVIGLQSIARGYLFRQIQWPMLSVELMGNRLLLVQHSNTIKRCLRRNLPATNDRICFLQMRAAATVLQQKLKAHQAMNAQRRKYVETRAFTIQLQSHSRGYLFRQLQWPTLKIKLITHRQLLIKCVVIIRRTLMNRLANGDRQRFLKLRNAAIVVQRKFRTQRQLREYWKLRASVISIQRRFRANTATKLQRDKYILTRKIVIQLQAYARGFLIRQKWPEKRCELQVQRDHLTAASNIIKRFLRQCLPTVPERFQYLALRQATVLIQSKYRAIKTARLDRTEYLWLRQCTIVLQTRFRARRATRSSILLQTHIRGYLVRKKWPQLKQQLEIERKHAIKALQEKNNAACKIQAAFKGFLTRQKLPKIKEQLLTDKQICAASLIQARWRGYCVRKKYRCRRETLVLKTGALTLAMRHKNVTDVLNKQKQNEYSYRELARVFWNLDTCTALSKELCVKTIKGPVVDFILHFFQTSNQSQPSIECREPALLVLINLLRYHETSQFIWMKVINTDMIKQLIKMMKSNCGKLGTANRVYCLISTWMWIALQDPEKKHYIQKIPTAIIDLKFMKNTLYRRNKMHQMDRKKMVLPSTKPTWFIGSKCQKCFKSDLFATIQVCKMLNI